MITSTPQLLGVNDLREKFVSKVELTRMNSFEYNFDQIKTNLFSKLLLDGVQA